MRAVMQITLYDEDTGAVAEQLVEIVDSSYNYEVERQFRELGERMVKKLGAF